MTEDGRRKGKPMEDGRPLRLDEGRIRQMSEGRDQRSEVRGLRTEGGGQTTDDGGQMTPVKFATLSSSKNLTGPADDGRENRWTRASGP
jgi:hypothetical protein